MIKIESPIRNEYYKKLSLRDDTNLKRSKSSSDLNRAMSSFNLNMEELDSGTIFVPENFDPVLKCHRDIKGTNHYYNSTWGVSLLIKKYILQIHDSCFWNDLPSYMGVNNPRALSIFYCKPLVDSGKMTVIFHGGYHDNAGHSTWAIQTDGSGSSALGTTIFPDSTSDKSFHFQPHTCSNGTCYKSYTLENSMVDKWLHYFLMHDGASLKLYLNGKVVWDYLLGHTSDVRAANGSNDQRFRFGQLCWVNTNWAYSSTVLPQHGKFAFPFWFKKPISEEKVQQIYATGRSLIEEQGETFYNLT